MTAAPALTLDDLAPRTLDERFRIYRREGEELRLLATTPDAQGIGVALLTLNEEGDIGLDDAVGILDTCPGGVPRKHGKWIANPWALGR